MSITYNVTILRHGIWLQIIILGLNYIHVLLSILLFCKNKAQSSLIVYFIVLFSAAQCLHSVSSQTPCLSIDFQLGLNYSPVLLPSAASPFFVWPQHCPNYYWTSCISSDFFFLDKNKYLFKIKQNNNNQMRRFPGHWHRLKRKLPLRCFCPFKPHALTNLTWVRLLLFTAALGDGTNVYKTETFEIWLKYTHRSLYKVNKVLSFISCSYYNYHCLCF